MSSEKLIIFDYSGTLSLEASLFARPDNLMKELEESGLKEFGIERPDIFWEQLVNPTWTEGSTTPMGYKKILENQITATLDPSASITSRARIADAVSSFVDRYLDHSHIDCRWKPLLNKLNVNPSIKVLIATDHYGEATDCIIKFLTEFQIHAAAAKHAFLNFNKSAVIVANSADIGFHKVDPRFWETLKLYLDFEAIQDIIIIDDFGYNEQIGDRYGERQIVEARKQKTVKMLESAFSAKVHVVPFMIEDNDLSQDDIYGNLITSAATTIERYLAH
jgi:hypothetical protein